MYCHKISKKLIWGIALIVLILTTAFPYQSVMSKDLPPDNHNMVIDASDSKQIGDGGGESPQELSDEELQRQIEELEKYSEGHVVLYDLENPEGIDPKLLPSDIAALVDGNTKVVAYKETTRPLQIQSSECFEKSNIPDQYVLLGIPCASPDGTRDTTVSSNFGNVTQYNRVYALRYDDAPWNPSQPLTGWEYEQMWSKWTRSDAAWYVADANMRIEAVQNQDYCTGNTLGGYVRASNWFDPGWATQTSTNWFSISGFLNTAYVPGPYYENAYVQADIYQDYELEHDNARTEQHFYK